MAIIARSGTFKPSDPFGLYRDRANPLDATPPAPAPVDPEQLRAADEIRRAEEANAQVDQSWEQLEQQEPGRYQVIASPAYEEWRTQWEAKQPGWLEDTARILGGSLAKGTGAVVGGLGNAVTALTNATTTPIINTLFGTEYGKANPLGAPAEWINTLGEKTQEGVSFATREAIENSTPGGDLLDPSSWTLGKNPSAVGYGALVLDVFGQMTPVIAAAIVAGPVGGAAVGGLQGGGAAAQQASAIIDQMAAEPGLLERESAFYRELIAAGKTHEEALAATKAAAEQAAFALASPISALGGFATGKIIDPATAILAGRNLITRITGRAALSGLEEGAQEAAETAATRAGVNVGADTSIALTEGTFADFMLGALAGGAPGAIAGGFSPREFATAPADAPAATDESAQPVASTPPAGAPEAAQAPAPKAGPLASALEHGLSQAPSPNAGQAFIVNDPPLPGMGAGREHGMTVTLAPDQSGIDPNMRRVLTADGAEHIMGVRLLQPVDGSEIAPDPQATSTPITVSNVAPGLPEAGSRVIVEAPGMETFNARVETYVTSDGGGEAVVVDDFGEVLQLPVEYLRTAGLTDQMIAAAELAENPPVDREPVPESPTVRQVGPAALTFPDETLARLYDLGRERMLTMRLERGANGASGLATREAMRAYAPDRMEALAEELGVLPERINDMADDYRYRVERAAKRAQSGLPQNMHGLNRDRLKALQAERSRSGDEATEAGLISTEAASSPSDDFAAWWNGLSPGARKVLLASAGVKRSEKSTWDKFSKAIKGRLMPLREEMATLDRARANSQALDAAAHAAATSPNNDLPEPTPAQKEAGNYALGHARVGGMDLSIENPAGSARKGTDKSGKPWSVTMKSHYGYIKGTIGKDKDHIDVFVKPGTDEMADDAPVFVVDQVNEGGAFDEHKVMLGFADQAEAEAAYLENYTKGWKGMGGVGATTLAEFKQWLKSGNTRNPFGKPTKAAVVKTAPKSDLVAEPATQPAAAPQPKVERPTREKPSAADERPPRDDTAQVAADPAFEADRQAMRNFKKGDRVEWTRPGTFRQADGTTQEGLVLTGTIERVHSKELGTFTVDADRGGSTMVPARMLRPESAPASDGGSAAAPAADPFAKNKLFTADKVAAARERLKSKMGQLNSGIDPEVLVDGMTIAGAYIESGVRDFSDYAARMTEDFGDRIKPYLLSFWEGARNYPGLDTQGMTPAEDSARQHAAMIDPLPQEEAPALGQELAPPRKRTRKTGKTGKAGDRTLIQDFGAEHIEDAMGYLRAVADRLQEDGWSPHEDKKGRPEKPVSRNEAGIAVSGDVHLTLWEPETGARLYAHVGGGSLRGVVPSTKSGVQVMFRVGVETDKYATGAMNQWAPVDLSAADFAAMVRQHADRAVALANGSLATDKQNVISDLKALIARPALTPAPEAGNENAEPRVGSRDPQGVDRAAGGREPDPQRGPAQADDRDLEAGEPADVAPPAERGDGRNTRTRAAAADVEGAGGPDLFGNAGDGRPRAGGAPAPDARAGERERPSRATDTGPVVKDPETVSPANTGPGNFHIADPLKIVGGGQVARFEKNKAAITLAGQLRDDGRMATREEQEILAGYTGWGSFGQDLFQGTWANPRPKAGWEARDAWLRENLGQAEWESLQRSITNAHYTDPPTVLAMWDMVKRMGFAGGRVLEPSMGIGNFFGMMPLELKNRSRLTGVELERVTGEMAQQLYPDANISIMGYQDSKTPDDFYDLVIGNWPFENTVIADRRYNRLSPMLHDYFYLKAVDQVRPGGLVVGITSKGTMDKKDSTIRTELAKKAELVAAFRLPSGAFEDYAGTKVVTDIIILRKRDKSLGVAANEGWIKSVPFKTPAGEDVSINAYYAAHPSHVIGTIDFGTGTTFNRAGMIVRRPDDVAGELKRVAALVPQDAYRADSRPGEQISYITNHTDDREGALTRGKGGGLYIVRGEHLVATEDVAKYAVKDPKTTAARKAQLEALIDMRNAYAELIAAERSPDGKPEPARKTLRKQFEAFTAEHGPLTESYGLAYLRKIDDPFYPALAALESRTANGIKPAGILSQSTIRAARKIDKPTVSDAFVLARNSAINPSLAQIAEIAQKPEAEVRTELLAKGAVFELPNGDIVPSDLYLSGNVREKMRQARAALDDGNQAMERNVDALAKAMPPDVPYFNIEVQMGASWVPTGVYAEYVAHMLNAPSADDISVSYTAGRWRITLTDALKNRPEARAGFGTEAYAFRKLVNAAISNQTVVIRKEDSDGNTYVDQEETAEVNGKIEQIRTSFGDWLWSDPTRRLEMESEYNEVRNAFASPSFDGSFLSFEGMALSLGNGPFDLRQHQVDATWRALVMRRSLNAHEVGTGKTFTMGGIAVESRRYGIARKPLILAHNANSKSVAAEIQQMYPAAKVLYIDNLAPAQIDVKMRQIANDDWDAVVVPHSLISRFSLTEETLMALAAEEIAAIEAEAYAAADDDGVKLDEKMLDDPEELKKLRSPTAKDLVKMRNRIIESIKKQGQRASKEGALSFEELGVDMLLVDEAHEFKKPPFSTRMRIKGLNTQSSDKSIALNFLTRYIRGANNGGNVHLFTGTPVTNTLTEVFHMMRYMMAEEMADMSVDQWDGWFGSFAKEVQDVELNAAAEYEAVNRLAGFINVPELRRMIGQYMDVVFADDMPEMQPRRTDSGKTMASPDLTERERATLLNGRTENAKDRPYKKVIVDTADLTDPQQTAFKRIQALAQRWRQMTGKEKREAMQAGMPESPIIYEGLAAKASFDVRLMRGEDLAGQEGKVADDPDSKPSRAIRNLIEIYKSHPKATQVVFTSAGISNVATRSVGPVGEKTQQRYKVFSTVDDMVERLVQQGIPRKEIAVVDGSTSKDKRKEIADAMNRAEIRIVIGSTQSLGVGVNMQRNLRAMHHMDAPWMPGDLEQRNGRGHRQGNQWNTVLEYRYVTDRLDGRRWQVLAIKQRFINAFLKADDSTRIIEGDAASDEESDILQTFAEAAGDPRVLIREKLKKKIEQFKKRQRLHDTGIVEAGNSVKRLERRNAELEKEIARKTPIADKVDEVVKANAGDGFSITIDGTRHDSRGDAREAIDAYVESKGLTRGSDSRSIGKFGGFALTLRWPGLSADPVVGLNVDGEHIEGAVGSLGSLEAALRNYRAGLERLAPEIAENRRSIERLRQATAEPFHQAADLERAQADFEALEADLRENPVPPPAWLRAGAPVDTEVTWKAARHVVTGHRWNKDGWFVLASGDDGPIAMPYLEVRDDQGMALYEERPFEAPEVVEKAKPTQAANDADPGDDTDAVPAARAVRESRRSVGRLGRTVGAVRTELHRAGFGNLITGLEQAARLRIVDAAEVGAEPEVQGWTDEDGSITLIADQIAEGDAVSVLLHEAFHSGARPLLGTPAFGSLMVRLAGLYRQFEQSKGRARDFFDAARTRVSAAEDQAGALTEPLRVEEFAAYAIEEHASAPAALAKWVEDFLGEIKAWALKRFGRQLGAVTPGQLRAIAVTALRDAVGAGALPQGVASRRQSIAGTVDRAKVTITRERIGDEIGGKLTDLKPALLAVIPLNYFSELKRPGMYAVDQYLKVKRMMDAYRGNKHAAVDEVAQAWRKYARMGLGGASADGKTRAAALAELMHETTLAGIDPSATDAETVAKSGYDALRARYMAMPEAGRALYRKVRDTYRDQADELDGILLDNVRKTQEIAFRRAEDKYREKLREIRESGLKGLDKSAAEREAQDIYSAEMNRATWNMKARMTKLRLAFEASRVPAPYFPLARFGRYFVSVKDIDGTVLSFSKRESDAERRRLERDMRAAFPNAKVESGLMPEQSGSRDMMDPRIVAEIETLLGDAGVDGQVMDMIWQRYLETMPDLSARKRFIHRKGVAGFDGDALRTFASNQFHAAHQMARLKYGLELQELANQATDQARKSDDPVRGMVLANELKRRHEWVMNPTGSRAVQAVTSSMFVWYLAATPAAALVNMTQTPMMGIPVLGARLGGVGKAAAAITKASADVLRGRGSARRAALTADERRAMEAFYESGMIDRTQAHDLAGVGEVGVAYSPLRHKIMSVISWAYHNVEVWNREVTALAAYRMARDKGQHESQAIDTAHQLTWAAHFDYSNSSRARIMQSDPAKLLLVFQSHQLNMWYRLFRDIHQSVKGESPQARKEARYQLAGILGMMSLFSGITGFFGYNLLVTLAGLAFDDDDDPRSFKAEMEGHVIDLLGPDLGGMVLKGVPGHLLGIDLSSRLGMPDFFVRAPYGGSEGRDWFQDLIIGAMGVVPATAVNAFDGVNLIMQGNVVRGMEAMAPKAVKDMLQAYRYANEGVLSRRGDVVLEREQLAPWDVIAEAVGFTPAKVSETYDRLGVLKDAEQFVLDERRELMNRFALAHRMGDDEGRTAAIEAIKAWNRKPYARAVPITSDSLRQSLQRRAANAAKRQDGVFIPDPELSHLLRQAMPERIY